MSVLSVRSDCLTFPHDNFDDHRRGLTLDKQLLAHRGFAPGDQVVVEPLPGGRLEVRRPRGTGKISDVAGFLRDDNGPRLTIDEINEATAKGWAGGR